MKKIAYFDACVETPEEIILAAGMIPVREPPRKMNETQVLNQIESFIEILRKRKRR